MTLPTTKMVSDLLSDKILVHAVVYADGHVGDMSIVTRFIDGTYTLSPYIGESSGVSFTNSIAVIAPSAASVELDSAAIAAHSIPALIAAVRTHLAATVATGTPTLHILTPGM